MKIRGVGKVAWVILAAGTWVVFEAARENRFLIASKTLQRRSASFPRNIQIGSGSYFRMVSLGDSTAEGVGVSSLENSLPAQIARGLGRRVVLTNLAKSGAILQDLIDHQISQIPSGHLDLIMVSISANDVTHNTAPAQFQSGFRSMLESLHSLKPGRIIVCTTPNYSTSPAVPYLFQRVFYGRARRLTYIIESEVAKYPGVAVADLFRRGNLPVTDFASDGFHPNKQGYRSWADIYLQALGVSTS